MSRKRIKRKAPKAKDLKALRKRIQKAIIEVDEVLTSDEGLLETENKVLDDFQDIT